MKKFLEGLGALLLVAGVAGVIREMTDGWFHFLGLTRFLTENVGFLEGRELFANIVVAVLGLALAIGASRMAAD
ncbi:hypothetical protein GCM10010222_42880 [Streptomyces tanashiensis]|uniref:DUF4321 domain-containing protein n=1 Tax=Streptomyces tanashiensis TaxID=67367 RepID=A0ABY6QWE3_9ACTN|nr:hypothetical protein [Streptomyces tanashiensis]UZX20804.1 hypothetical protein LDH80_08810 [Streptomyces tanashiensis]GGS96590.1 hypothetical protein GCM10010222_42880 [Streptomyces tanashiensis]GGY36149.1 hypothetical protein GCM10010299_48140 [Streptomyces tanashiensis]